MRALRHLLPAAVAVALVPFAAAPANAAPPDNDESAGAVVLHLGDRVEQDTTQATTTSDDDALNANCGAPFTNASVWYQYTPDTTGNVVLDTSESDYTTGVMIFDGVPTADSLLACGPEAAGLRAHAGKTYYVMAFSDSEVNGGNLVLSLKDAPTPRVHVSLARHGVAFHGGAAKIHGTYSCTHSESFAEVDAQLKQRAGRLKIPAFSSTNARCNGKRHHWSARLVSPVGTYAKGPAKAKVKIISCGLLVCRHATVKADIRLTWAPGSHRQGMVHPSTARAHHPHPLLGHQKHWPARQAQ